MRKIIMDGIRAVQEGRDPKGVWQDPAMDRLLELGAAVTDSQMTRALEETKFGYETDLPEDFHVLLFLVVSCNPALGDCQICCPKRSSPIAA